MATLKRHLDQGNSLRCVSAEMDDNPYEALVQIFYHTAGQKVEAYVFFSLAACGLALIACAIPLPRPVEPAIAIFASTFVGAGVATFTILLGTIEQERVHNDTL